VTASALQQMFLFQEELCAARLGSGESEMGDLKEFLERQLAAAWEEQSCGHTCCAQVRLQVIADLKDLNVQGDANVTSAKAS